MASVASQLIEEVTAHAQSDSVENAWEICADGTYFPNYLHTNKVQKAIDRTLSLQGSRKNRAVLLPGYVLGKLIIHAEIPTIAENWCLQL